VTLALAAPVLEFDDESHTYRLHGAVIPSVSSILAWKFGRPNVPAHILDVAADRGRKCHLACELFDVGDLDEDSIAGTDLAGYLAGWRRYCERGVRGTVDLKSKARSGKAPKPGSDEFVRHGLQLAAYAPGRLGGGVCTAPLEGRWAHVECRCAWVVEGAVYAGTIDRRAWDDYGERRIVYLWPNGHVEAVDYTPYNDEFDEAWRDLLRAWRAAKAAEEDADADVHAE
jgi:hypothetical protein